MTAAGQPSIWHGQCELPELLSGVPLLISPHEEGEQLGLSALPSSNLTLLRQESS